MSSFRHRYAARLNSFRGLEDARATLARMAAMPGLSAVELNYPEHFIAGSEIALIEAAGDLGFDVTALNLRYDPSSFRLGAFTNPDPAQRERALQLTREAVDLAASGRIPHVILWMGPDGFDYPFQADYARLWEMEIDGFREIAQRQPDVRVSVEPKPSDPRRFSLIRSTSDALLAVQEINLPNFGVTLDFCHSLMAGESPAAAAVSALRVGKLFGIHLNDGYGAADDGLMVGSIHFQQTLELLSVARQFQYRAPIYFDTFPMNVEPSIECSANIAEVERMEMLLDRIDIATLRAAQAAQDAIAATQLVRRALEP